MRILLDPTFDAPKKYKSGLEKVQAPAVGADAIGEIDAVLLSHDQHDDNLDDKGRELLETVPVVLSTPGARQRLGDHVTGMKAWATHELKTSGGTVTVTAVPALHGPDGVDRGADGEVTGFVLSGTGVPTTYVSGDNASVKVAKQVGDRVKKEIGPIDTAVLFAGCRAHPRDPRQRAADPHLEERGPGGEGPRPPQGRPGPHRQLEHLLRGPDVPGQGLPGAGHRREARRPRARRRQEGPLLGPARRIMAGAAASGTAPRRVAETPP